MCRGCTSVFVRRFSRGVCMCLSVCEVSLRDLKNGPGQALRPSEPVSVPLPGQPLHWGEGPVLAGGEDNGERRPPRTLGTHLTNPRRVRRGGGPALRGRGGGRSHLPAAPGFFLLSRPGLPGLPRPRRLLSAGPAARGPTGAGPSATAAPTAPPGCLRRGAHGAAAALRARTESWPQPLAPSRAHLPRGGESRGRGGLGSGVREAGGLGRRPPVRSAAPRAVLARQRRDSSSGAPRKEAAALAAAAVARRAMSSWTAPRNMSICTTACRRSRGGWG